MREFSIAGLPGIAWRRSVWCWLLVWPAAVRQVFDDVEADRNQEYGDEACGKHPAKDGETEKDSPVRPGSRSQDEGDDTEDKRKRRHEDGTKP